MVTVAEARYKALYKIYTGPLLKLVPGSSESFGPPRRRTTSEEYARKGLGKWIETLPAHAREMPPPIVSWGERPQWGSTIWSEHPAQGVLIAENARIRNEHGYPVVSGDQVLEDATFLLAQKHHDELYRHWKLGPVRNLPGATLNLMSAFASLNYSHAMLDALPRVAMFLKAGFTFGDVDHILVPNFAGDDFRWLVDRLNIPTDKVKYLEKSDHWKCDVLFQPNFPGRKIEPAEWVPNFYRELLGLKNSSRDRLLYVPRRGYLRNISNEEEVAATLAKSGFQEISTTNPLEKFIHFSEARAVIGPHGAGLANLAVCHPGTKVLELLPTDHQFHYWYALSYAAELEFHVLLGESKEKRKSKKDLVTSSDFHVPIEGLKASLQSMGI